MITDNASDYATMSREELRAFVTKNAEALKLARTGLGRECRVPLDYPRRTIDDDILSRLAGMKRLVEAMSAEGRLAEMENRPADAMEAYLAVIRLGYAISRGGLILDCLVGIATESIGTAILEKLVPTLNAKQCREAPATIESCEAQREPTEAFSARAMAYAHRTYGFRWQFARLFHFRTTQQDEQRMATKVTTQQTRNRPLLIRLATRAYELDKGQPPKRLADLVPAYLKAIPQEPRTGTNMTYP